MPIDRVSIGMPSSASNSPAAEGAQMVRAVRRSRCGSRQAHEATQPELREPGYVASQCYHGRSRRYPTYPASSSMLTCRQTLSSSSSSGRCSDRRFAVLRRSIVWTQSKCSATVRVLFDCKWPMKCQQGTSSGLVSASFVIFSMPSWTVFSPKSRCPAAATSMSLSSGCFLLTASR